MAPLFGKLQSQQVNGVELFELPNAVVAVGGIGEKFARRAAEVAIEYAQPKLLISAGIAGAISPELKVGDVGRIREVVDVATGDALSGGRRRLGAGDVAGCQRRGGEAELAEQSMAPTWSTWKRRR